MRKDSFTDKLFLQEEVPLLDEHWPSLQEIANEGFSEDCQSPEEEDTSPADTIQSYTSLVTTIQIPPHREQIQCYLCWLAHGRKPDVAFSSEVKDSVEMKAEPVPSHEFSAMLVGIQESEFLYCRKQKHEEELTVALLKIGLMPTLPDSLTAAITVEILELYHHL
ncbi:hypothetical protein FISHEDRAFT_71740 [Fistulina hepatica ATCC 64428]|uniref:Uncharacterized protein n=1 Tax=Fistulina hepatica ATCC 64428 TaxID=1128425 RepID=A0A0D7AIM5_9AGAR|nr:hypothetical protein FISHEDRAFT_71740 [Fistulina hepatica ATCC 64428]